MPSRYSDYRVDLNAELIWLPNWPTFHQISVATIKKIDSGDDINNTRFPICIGFNHFANHRVGLETSQDRRPNGVP